MRILVVGGGGREHALSWKLRDGAEVLCAPGNPGIAEDVEVVETTNYLELAAKRNVDLVVVGPENPLVDGLADQLRDAGFPVYGPGRAGAQLEGSKAFSKACMERARVPTAPFQTFTSSREAIAYSRERFAIGRRTVVKASGLFVGKGVIVADTADEADEALARMLDHHEFGESGHTVVVEDRIDGQEFSLLTIVGDENIVSLPVAQDHKRIFDGDLGPNTGGMGTRSPVAGLTPGLVAEAEGAIVGPILAELRREGIPFRGTLFSGIMVEGDRCYCLEYNVRFGDPEIQSVVRRLGAGFGNALYQAATGQWIAAPEVLDNHVVSVVMASEGYPGDYPKGRPITMDPLPEEVKVFHAGTAMVAGNLATAGGRVLCVSAAASTLALAEAAAYRGVGAIHFEGAQWRTDIAS